MKKLPSTGGRPKEVFTDEEIRQIEAMAAAGLNEEDICSVLDINRTKLLRRKRDQQELLFHIKKGKSKAKGKVGNRLFQKAVEGDTSAIIWYEKTRFEYRDKTYLEQKTKSENMNVNLNTKVTLEEAKKYFEENE